MMPVMDGIEALRTIRSHGISTPVIFLTAKDAVSDRVKGLNIGANDYIVKPFSFDELIARINAVTRTAGGNISDIITLDDLSLDVGSHIVKRSDETIPLGGREYYLLEYLLMNKGRILSREKILSHVRGYDFEGGENIVDVYIHSLRKKIDTEGRTKLIRSVRGIGYVMYIKTLGAHCAPVATDRGGGTIVVSSSKLFASGDGSPCIYSTGDITAESCSGKATGSQIAVVEGKNSITLKDCTLIGAGKNGVMLYQSTSGDAAVVTAVFTSEDSTLKTTSSGPMFYITNTDAVINLKNTKLIFSSGELLNAAGNNTNNWGKVGSNGGNVTLNAESQTLNGNVTCDNISTVSMSLASSTVFTGAVDSGNTGDVTITLDKTSKWNVTADSYVTAIIDADSTFPNIVSNGHTIYYSTSDSRNSSLNGKTVTLSDGGKLVPVK